MKMKNVIIAATLVLLALACTGCSKGHDAAEPVNIAFVLGVADDETVINTGIEELAALPAQPGTTYAFISPESSPTTIGEPGVIADLTDRGYTSHMMTRVHESMKDDIADKLSSYVPSTSQIDMAGAISLAVRTINANKLADRQNILVIYCGGKSTSGLINMLETPVYQMDIEASAKAIAAKMNCSMADIDELVWYCLGDFGPKQSKLNDTEKSKLEDFYTQLFVALGMDAEHINFKEDLPSTEYYSFPDTPVSAMEIEGVSSGLKEMVILKKEIFEEEPESVLEKPIVITEGQVNYLPDSDQFKDPEAAALALQPLVDYLVAHEDQHILVYSTTAGDSDTDYSQRLAAQRSARIATLIAEAGVEDERITVVAVKKSEDPYFQFGLGTGDAAVVNRKTVIIIGIESDLAQQLLSKGVQITTED